MVDFSGPKAGQLSPQGLQSGLLATRIEPADQFDLVGVVLFNEGLYCLDSGVHSPRAEARRQSAGQPPGDSPQGQKPAALPRRQQLPKYSEMLRFRSEVLLSESFHGRVARGGHYAAIDHHGSRFTRVVCSQVGYQ
jgi:hypothetical protein